MNARTRSDILAASSGMATSRAAVAMAKAGGVMSIEIERGEEPTRVLLVALEFAIEAAHGSDEVERLTADNVALRSQIKEWEDNARANLREHR